MFLGGEELSLDCFCHAQCTSQVYHR